ncbi:MAG: pentapeptide repeat-containing protein [bacterium]
MKQLGMYVLLLLMAAFGLSASAQLTPLNEADYQDSVFTEFVYFGDIDFISTANFQQDTFAEDALFLGSRFNGEANFIKTYFKGTAEFNDCQFLTEANFGNAEFKSLLDFTDTRFDDLADLSYVKADSTTFLRTTFNSEVNLSNAKFDYVNFSETEFNSDADFTFVTFNRFADFSKAEINGVIDFSNVVLPNKLDFSYTSGISGEIDLTSSTLNKRYDVCYIDLTGAAIENLRFRYNRFKLWFPDSTDFELRSNVYEALLNKQQELGFTHSYEKLDKEYREFKYINEGGGRLKRMWGHFKNWVDKNWWGYGYNKELIVMNTLLLYLLFAFINAFFLKHLTTNVYEAEKINEYWEETSGSRFNMFLKTIPFSMFYTAQIFFGFKFDVDKLKYKENLQGWKILNLVYFIAVFLTGLVCFAYLANYVVTV